MVFMVFSFQHYLSFVERFVENMLSRKCLIGGAKPPRNVAATISENRAVAN